jgi:branched-chain amino acid transport system permease protein
MSGCTDRNAENRPRAWAGGQRGRAVIAVLLVLAVASLVAGPAFVNPYWMRIGANIFMYVVLAQGINLIAGYTGYPAFGNVVFFGLGAYTTAVLMARLDAPFALAVAVAPVVCALVVLAVGPLLLRLKGHYFAIATLGLNEAVREIVSNTTRLTGGGLGISLPLMSGGPVASAVTFYYLFLGSALASTWITWEFSRRRLGIACQAIRDNEAKAEACGLYTTRYKTTVWMISAAMTGAMGSMNAYWTTYIDPPAVFDMAISVKSFVIFLLGGSGTVFGPVIGAFFVELLATFTWSNLLNWHLGAMGLIIMLSVTLFPNGLREALQRMPPIRTLASRLRRQAPEDVHRDGADRSRGE